MRTREVMKHSFSGYNLRVGPNTNKTVENGFNFEIKEFKYEAKIMYK